LELVRKHALTALVDKEEPVEFFEAPVSIDPAGDDLDEDEADRLLEWLEEKFAALKHTPRTMGTVRTGLQHPLQSRRMDRELYQRVWMAVHRMAVHGLSRDLPR
jgi:hypothetical protein